MYLEILRFRELYLPTAISLGTVVKQSSAIVKVPFVDSGLYAVRVGTPGVNCKTAAGGDLAIQNTIVPAPMGAPKPMTTPTPIAAPVPTLVFP